LKINIENKPDLKLKNVVYWCRCNICWRNTVIQI